MRELRIGHIRPFGARCVPVACMLITLLVVLAASCTEEKKYRILSSLFDGVPPLGGDTSATRSSRSLRPTRLGEESSMYVHKPQQERQCVKCHGFTDKGNFAREVQLTAPVPDLCIECHPSMAELEGWVHGPVAAGDCLMCHEPHRSKNAHLLKLPVPDMCFRCHDPKAIASIENHGQDFFVKCILCHFGHTSESRYLLRGRIPEPEELRQLTAKDANEPESPSVDQIALEAGGKIGAGQSLEEMLADVHDLIREGRIEEARGYIKAIMQSTTFTDDQKRSIAPTLLRMQGLQKTVEDKPKETTPPKEQPTQEQPVSPPEEDRSEVEEKPSPPEEDRSEVEEKPSPPEDDHGEVEKKPKMSPEQTGRLYMESLKFYKAGELLKAKSGFEKVLYEGTVPPPVEQAVRQYLSEIEKALAE